MQHGIEQMIVQSMDNSQKLLENKESESAQILQALNEKIEKECCFDQKESDLIIVYSNSFIFDIFSFYFIMFQLISFS